MDITATLQQLDALFEQDKTDQIEGFLMEAVSKAFDEQDYDSLLALWNELIGFYRETCAYDKMQSAAKEALFLLKQRGLEGSLAYGNTLVNIANGLRSAGRLEQSQAFYVEAEAVYEKHLPKNDMQFSALYNNLSLLYQEMGQYEQAYDCLGKALSIVQQDVSHAWETAVTKTNLANTLCEMARKGQPELFHQAKQYALEAVSYFKTGHKDTHYAAALVALGQCAEQEGDDALALTYYEDAMRMIKTSLGKTDFYARTRAYYEAVKKKLDASFEHGLSLCQEYYETYAAPLLKEHFPAEYGRMIAGLCGEGSDCFGFDDAFSKDHDWGPGFVLLLDDDCYEKIGSEVEACLQALPVEFKGMRRQMTKEASGRIGVMSYAHFYDRLFGDRVYAYFKEHKTLPDAMFLSLPAEALAAASNGTLWYVGEQVKGENPFLSFRAYLKKGYPMTVRYRLLERYVRLFSQGAQYNAIRMARRKDKNAALLCLMNGLAAALKIGYIVEGAYPLPEKWLFYGSRRFQVAAELSSRAEDILDAYHIWVDKGEEQLAFLTEKIEQLSEYLIGVLIREGYLLEWYLMEQTAAPGDAFYTDTYLEHYAMELSLRAELSLMTQEELTNYIAKMEFQAFDLVKNEGGRASCQDDWETFYIMRYSQYILWTRPMLTQYVIDFKRNMAKGWNPIMEKYGRMEQSTAPEQWERIKDQFPVIPEQKKAIMEEIIRLQVAWMEEFAAAYPNLAGQARTIHTADDTPYDTSYETYLRGELSTYGDNMLKLYGQYIVAHVQNGENLAEQIMEGTVKQYGYASLAAAEQDEKRTGIDLIGQ